MENLRSTTVRPVVLKAGVLEHLLTIVPGIVLGQHTCKAPPEHRRSSQLSRVWGRVHPPQRSRQAWHNTHCRFILLGGTLQFAMRCVLVTNSRSSGLCCSPDAHCGGCRTFGINTLNVPTHTIPPSREPPTCSCSQSRTPPLTPAVSPARHRHPTGTPTVCCRFWPSGPQALSAQCIHTHTIRGRLQLSTPIAATEQQLCKALTQ